ncbi:Putative Lysophospholipase, Monoglyceride lipase [Salinispira pacifica]|uniref:Putative Lysophospholipase, Monoglyceride lipase n=2 Tax=Salinispira pacifica TaxID=1307761 RepID=V5WD06_9SPIO|nr:Putative Lysophospholipase, Monoglyceride lipase [Salinispira pacifica]
MAFARIWHAKGEARGIILLVHGALEHSGRYGNFALFLAHHGYHVVGYDLRAHGYSALSSKHAGDSRAITRAIQETPDFGYMPGEEGWYLYLDDFAQVVDYISARYSGLKIFVFSHSMGSMIARSALSLLPPGQLGKIRGMILSGTPGNGGLRAKAGRIIVNSAIKKNGDAHISPKIHDLAFGPYSKSRKFSSVRTEQDWISSVPDEVDSYIADPLCGTLMRLGFYKTLAEGNIYLYSKAYKKALTGKSIPLMMIAGDHDPVSSFGRSVLRLADFFRRLDWQDVRVKIYPQGRHELLHDAMKARVYDDLLDWLNEH